MKQLRLLLPLVIAIGLVTTYRLGKRETRAAQDESSAQQTSASAEQRRKPAMGRPTRAAPTLRPELLQQAADGVDRAAHAQPAQGWARNSDYERLLTSQSRDQVYEGKLYTKLLETFSMHSNVSIGDVACSAQFCRAEVAGIGPDFLKEEASLFVESLEPKGMNYVLADVGETSTKLLCYFGRDESWNGVSVEQAL